MIRREDLAEPHWSAIQAIVAGEYAWTPLLGLEARGHGGVIGELVSLGLVAIWSLGDSTQVTLTPYGAWLAGVQILERTTVVGEELSEDPYWAEWDREPAPLRLPKRRHEVRWPWLDALPDPKADQPVDAVMLDEVSGDPVLMWGQTVRIDRRLGKAKGAGKAKRRRAG